MATQQSTIRLHEIHCVGCEQTIESNLAKVPRVLHVKADHRTKEVRVRTDPGRVSTEDLKGKLTEIGFEPEETAR